MIWKFHSLVGTVGIVLLVAAFFSSTHSVTELCDSVNVAVSSGSISNRGNPTPTLAVAGTVCVAWQVVMTVLGLIFGFLVGGGRKD